MNWILPNFSDIVNFFPTGLSNPRCRNFTRGQLSLLKKKDFFHLFSLVSHPLFLHRHKIEIDLSSIPLC